MTRIGLLLFAALACGGCSREPDRPRSVPTNSAAAGSDESARAKGELPPERKIDMH